MKGRAVVLASTIGVFFLASGALSAQSAVESRHFVTSDSVRLHYLEAGSGPLLVFVPGWTMPAWIWEPQIEHFDSEYRVVALDPRGQGASEKPAHGYHPGRRAADVCELLAHLGGEPAVVAGWSIAVQEVLLCAHEHGSEAIRAAVLVDHPVHFEFDPVAAFTDRFRSLQLEREAWTREFVDAIHAKPQPDGYLDDLTEAALSMPTNAAAMVIANIMVLERNDLRPALDALERPALFVYSELDWALEAAEVVREGWPEVQVEVLEETSHALFRDRPDEFHRVLEEFLASLPDETGRSDGLAYEVRGSGEPVLLIHGSYLQDALVPVMEEPALGGHRLIHYHRRSYGGSVPHDSTLSIEGEAEDALSLLRELDVESAHVVGFSYGGVIAFELARSAPEAVRSLVLIEPPLPVSGGGEQGPPPFLAEAVGRYQEGDTAGAVHTFMQGVASPGWRSSVEEAVPNAGEQALRNAAHFFERELPALGSYRIEDTDVSTLPPVLYLFSEAGETRPWHAELLDWVRTRLPKVNEFVVSDTDHLLPMQRPEAVAEGIAGFIARLSEDRPFPE